MVQSSVLFGTPARQDASSMLQSTRREAAQLTSFPPAERKELRGGVGAQRHVELGWSVTPAAYAGAAERRTAHGVGPCGIEHAIENRRADHGLGAPGGIAVRAQLLIDERLVAAYRGLDQRACRSQWPPANRVVPARRSSTSGCRAATVRSRIRSSEPPCRGAESRPQSRCREPRSSSRWARRQVLSQ